MNFTENSLEYYSTLCRYYLNVVTNSYRPPFFESPQARHPRRLTYNCTKMT
jgi:hypothetical protein